MSFPLIIKQTSRPVCVHCGAKCGRKHHYWKIDQQKRPPWDGLSWFHQYNPFCTLRCALDYARAYARGQ